MHVSSTQPLWLLTSLRLTLYGQGSPRGPSEKALTGKDMAVSGQLETVGQRTPERGLERGVRSPVLHGDLREKTVFYGDLREKAVFHECLQEACFVLTEISGNLREFTGECHLGILYSSSLLAPHCCWERQQCAAGNDTASVSASCTMATAASHRRSYRPVHPTGPEASGAPHGVAIAVPVRTLLAATASLAAALVALAASAAT